MAYSVNGIHPPDFEHVGDSALLWPPYTTRINVIADKGDITPEIEERLETLINDSFRARGMKLDSRYFSMPLWESFQYALIMEDLMAGRYVGTLLAFKPEDFVIYDKIAVHPGHRGRHYMTKLVQAARTRDKRLHGAIDAALKTSDKTAHEKYLHVCDSSAFVPQNELHSNYWVHFFDGDKKEAISDARKKRIATYLVEMPRTFDEMVIIPA
ncbi:GNAT family N-acetyltransferase [Candidatus Woesearchaeota archaeon]|nr:GNAT family N-acetyltransferase [Candidatus Woesearchaeota archaeon]